MMQSMGTASIIFAAGFGTRMKGFTGNKTLLPLVPGRDAYSGDCPILSEIVRNLPEGPKALVVHHRKEQVIEATRELGIAYCDQPVANGTGGALIATKGFMEGIDEGNLIITMGDVPFVEAVTYGSLVRQLSYHDLVVLGFKPKTKARYGVLEIENEAVKRIIEWRYWNEFPPEIQRGFEICNSGIYAANRSILLEYIGRLKDTPHRVEKERGDKLVVVEEYFITDLIEMMSSDGLRVGFTIAEHEQEVMGIDTREDLVLAQNIFAKRNWQAKRF
jgi:bifunctional UDP-N-acetylglucosamine pyrophosphorylase/glucosamine-1-phosphate N-acetyltransferase